MVSIGGAAGGVFVNFIAPVIFTGYWELTYGLALIWILLAVMTFIRHTEGLAGRSLFLFNLLVGAVAVSTLIFSVYYPIAVSSSAPMSERNFYGVVRVRKTEEYRNQTANILVHGHTQHGFQFVSAEEKDRPTSYFTEESGIGLAILNHPKRSNRMKVGVLGLGIGTLATYGQPGDEYRLYEINPAVIKLAEGYGEYFSFLQDSHADVSVVLGDARISLERELMQGENQQFDLLIMDAFSSGSVPVHLVTKEAIELYLQHLSAEGILAANISNNYLDLVPVFKQLADYFDLELVIIETPSNNEIGGSHSLWALMARNPSLLNIPAINERASTREADSKDISLWTDDYSNLFQILK
jgi:spermidine synthase